MALERAARREKEGTSAVLLQSALDEKWSADSMECYCYLRKVQDLLADWKIHHIPFGAMVEHHPISARDQSKFHQFGKKVLPGIILAGMAGGIWKGDIVIVDNEKLEKMDASEIYPRRINAKEVLISQKGEEFIFPVGDGTAKLSGREYEFREPTPRRERTARSEDVSGELQGER